MYRPSGKKFLLGSSWVMAILAATACQSASQITDAPQSAPQPTAGTASVRQLIIKFKPNTITCDAAGIAQLSSATRVPLEYVRPMSGGACVVRQLSGEADKFLRDEELLKKHPAIEWLEQDARKRAL
jgi:hypothetical protein